MIVSCITDARQAQAINIQLLGAAVSHNQDDHRACSLPPQKPAYLEFTCEMLANAEARSSNIRAISFLCCFLKKTNPEKLQKHQVSLKSTNDPFCFDAAQITVTFSLFSGRLCETFHRQHIGSENPAF